MTANMPKQSVIFLRRLQRICIVFLMSVTAVQAQQTLSLEDAVAHSLQNNLGIRLAQQQAEVAAIGNAWGAAGALPTLGVSATGCFLTVWACLPISGHWSASRNKQKAK